MKKSFLILMAAFISGMVIFPVLAQDVAGDPVDSVLVGKITAIVVVLVVALEQVLPYLPTKFNSITQGILQFLRKFLPR